MKLYDLEVDEAGHVLGAWLATGHEDSTLVRLEESFRDGRLARASRGSGGQAQAWMQMRDGLCRVGFAAGQSLGDVLPQPNRAAGSDANKGSPTQRLVQSVSAPDIAALLRRRFRSLPASASEAAEPRRKESGEPPTDASSSTLHAASTEDGHSGANVRVVRDMRRKRALAEEKAAASDANSTDGQRSSSL